MLRTPLLLIGLCAARAGSLQAQTRQEHRHPRGAKIIMIGTLVDPLCAFAQQMPDSAQAGCSREHPGRSFQPVLVAGAELYLLAFDPDDKRRTATQSLVGREVKVDGTVYPAGNTYLIVVDSVRLWKP